MGGKAVTSATIIITQPSGKKGTPVLGIFGTTTGGVGVGAKYSMHVGVVEVSHRFRSPERVDEVFVVGAGIGTVGTAQSALVT